MGEFSFRSASVMNINLPTSVGSLRKKGSKQQQAPCPSKGVPSLITATGLSGGDASRNLDSHNNGLVPNRVKYRTYFPADTTRETYSGIQVNSQQNERAVGSPNASEIPTTLCHRPSPDKQQLLLSRLIMKGHDQPSLNGGDGSVGVQPPVKAPTTQGGSQPIAGQFAVVKDEFPGEKEGMVTTDVSPSIGYRFHVREMVGSEMCNGSLRGQSAGSDDEQHPFSVARDVKKHDTFKQEKKIISSKGTVRGYKNRVKAGIATFLQQQDGVKNYRILEKGKIVLYTTNMMIVRKTYEKCNHVRKILQTHMVQYEERDIFMSQENQRELRQRLDQTELDVPQVFADGQHLGGAEELTTLNETGELRQIFKHFKKVYKASSCELCGGYHFIPCTSCHGSKKSLHRNHFTAEFCALRCIICDENGLIKCDKCTSS